jgi:hypothetical protein
MAKPFKPLDAGSAIVSRMALALSRILNLAGLLALLGLLAAAVIAGPSIEASLHRYEWYTISPLNPGDGGASYFYAEARSSYPIVLGNAVTASRLALKGYKILYILIGPDRSLSPEEIKWIVKAYNHGTLRILVADDLGVTEGLLEKLGGPTLGGLELNPNAEGDWAYILTIRCGDIEGTSSKSLKVIENNGVAACRYAETGEPAVVSARGPGWSGVVVVGDPSIYSNFMYHGALKWIKPTRRLALYTLKLAGAEEASLIVFDVDHYNATYFSYKGYYGVGLVAELFKATYSSLTGFTASHPATASATLTGLVLALAAILVGPSRGLLRPLPRRLDDASKTAVLAALALLGAEADEDLLASLTPEEAARLIEDAMR